MRLRFSVVRRTRTGWTIMVRTLVVRSMNELHHDPLCPYLEPWSGPRSLRYRGLILLPAPTISLHTTSVFSSPNLHAFHSSSPLHCICPSYRYCYRITHVYHRYLQFLVSICIFHCFSILKASSFDHSVKSFLLLRGPFTCRVSFLLRPSRVHS
ncbi:hypothetical protein DFH05DRAFT_162800 [Lentinula detonsa]|uniref:Uncharacterized protein n=1 Tax=Lentinula detonsa TaxID=2804962 RepID=A0A9W8PCA6_9AGAR|nr:hypothetical protein DFH05DRAFT_162800 [Lentinula detonsa]